MVEKIKSKIAELELKYNDYNNKYENGDEHERKWLYKQLIKLHFQIVILQELLNS